MADCDDFPSLYFPGPDGRMPWDRPGWAERDFDHDRLKTVQEWNDSGRVVKKGEKATHRHWFNIEQTAPFDLFYISKKNGKFRRIFSLYREQKSQLREIIPYLEQVLLQHDVHKVNYAFIRNRNCI